MSEEKQPVRSIVTPTRLVYDWPATGSQAAFLEHLSRGELLGERCPECEKVYCPPTGNCPRCGVATSEAVHVTDRGTIITFCIVRVPSENIDLKLPYCAANILLDGSDMPLMGLLGECEAEDVRIGMRVQARWLPKEEWSNTFENIKYFRPTDEPDIPVEKLGTWV